MYRQFNIQQFYVLPTQLYLCVLYGSANKQRLFPYTMLKVFLQTMFPDFRQSIALLVGSQATPGFPSDNSNV